MWIIYALLTAFFFATSDALTKWALRSRNEYFIAWMRLVSAVPVLVISLFLIEIPTLDKTFWIATLIALPLEVIAIILYTKALKSSPLTLTMPFLSFTPIFLIIVSYLMLGERVSLQGAIGILLIAIGSYILNIHTVGRSLIEPLRLIIKERGSIMMMAVAFIFSLTSSLGKMAIVHSSPIFFGSLYFILLTIIFTPIAMIANRERLSISRGDVVSLIPIGLTYSLMIIFHMIAMSRANVAYMISVKRMSIFFSILYGHILFKEERIGQRAFGALLMFMGFVLIVLSRGS
ncbi:MAG: EamA family transporter [Thermodesulfovibrionia bacterium]